MALLALVLLFVSVVTPRRAAASDITTPLIISGAVAGGVAVVLLIAILVEGNKKPDFLGFAPATDRPAQPGVHLGTHCHPQDGALTLVCW
jgi:hypothetical protein